MKHLFFLCGLIACLSCCFVAIIDVAADEPLLSQQQIKSFPLEQVRLLPSPFKEAQEKDIQYLLSVDPNRLLSQFRSNANLKPRAEKYAGWEGMAIAGHSLGHYLSAISMMFASTGDERLKQKADYIVDELNECQEAGKDGLISAIPDIRAVTEEIARGDIRSQGFDLNGIWVPWYTHHKIFAGLLDAHQYCRSEKALDIAKKFGDWGIETTKNLTPEQFQKMLRCEFGGMNEVYYNLFALTGEKKYLEMGDRFYHHDIFDPLSEGRDELEGKHANTQIPKIVGLARRAEITGNNPDDNIDAQKIAKFFWDCVVYHHTYVTGGHSMGEHFGKPDQLNDRLRHDTTETCNTYNMLKLSKLLYMQSGNPKYYDYYERALFNHILPSINRTDDANKLFSYFVPLQSGSFLAYSTPFDNWTCCHGTGMENPAKYNEGIYYQTNGELIINLLIPSVLDWKEKGVRVTVQNDQSIKVEATQNITLPIHVRIPRGTANTEKSFPISADKPTYFNAGTEWKSGETIVNLPFQYYWRLETMPDNQNRVAFFFGPWLYAGNLGSPDKPLAAEFEAVSDDKITIPVIVSTIRSPHQLLDLPKDEERNKNKTILKEVVRSAPVELVPFYDAAQRYIVYFDMFTPDEWKNEETKYAQEQERLAKILARTVDSFQPGEMQPERDHNFQAERSRLGTHLGRKWRDAFDGGFIEFDMKVDPEKPCSLILTYWGNDGNNRNFDILIDGKKIATQKLERNKPGEFFDVEYKIDNQNKKDSVHVRLQAHPGATAGGIFGTKILRDE
ncbi:MAG: beta-L-arabinofuranosidase domain-containing protein [Thermoguttaceae bacterium]